ncbi:hypothetical protein P691DRAFT_772355 [Macrolepiota fuliginosa MF-IS2]|uniref:Zn(2)-C6 fungal-type domain-containing protein n=1 Tax=Macrolepiota fuliginosa MF-IS2 TaxID=1400762 RepID=A0A9P6C5E2_9AGAR|nr:hypothetical protein P691DRAFT_772355 [Macrolepiota fuliginosa MF-IS2]
MYHLSHDAPGLSLFEQTLRENDDEFYKTFPAARIASGQWRPSYHNSGFLPGCGFQLHDPPHYDYPYDHSQQLSPIDAPPSAASPPLHLPASAYHHHQPAPSPDEDPTPYHAPPQQQYYDTPLPFTAPIPSPVHHDLSGPLSPPALVQATYAYDISTVKSEPQPQQPQFFVDPQPSPQRDSSIPPSRRNSHHISHRSQRRWSPQYARPSHPTHKSGGSGGIPIPIQAIGWPPTEQPPPTSTLSPNPNIGFNINNTNVGVAAAAVVQAAAAAVVVAATAPPAPASDPSSSPPVIKAQLSMPPAPNSPIVHSSPIGGGKRNPDKKPALACVFCRGRKIACGPPLKDGDGKTCNQCQRRSLRCEYPTESRRGMRKKPAANATPSNSASTSTSSSTDPTPNPNNTTANTTKNPKPNTNPDKSKATTNKK